MPLTALDFDCAAALRLQIHEQNWQAALQGVDLNKEAEDAPNVEYW